MTDFWWLTSGEKRKYIYIELTHHKPLREQDGAPYSAFMNLPLVDVKNINQWRKQYQNTNVYRSLKVWADESGNDAMSGPFIVDIDNESEDLSDALVVTQETLEYLRSSYGIKDDDIHIFFTGHKGFNLEIRPKAVNIVGTQEEQESKAEDLRKAIIMNLQQGKNVGGGYSAVFKNGKVIFKDVRSGRELQQYELGSKTINLVSQRGTVIDRIYDYVRLHGSLNRWVSPKGEIARMKIELSINELKSLTIEEIIAKSERN